MRQALKEIIVSGVIVIILLLTWIAETATGSANWMDDE